MPAGQEQFFSASYDKTTKILTTAMCAFAAAVAWGTGSIIALAAGSLAIVLCYAWSPRGYAISGGSILVKRLIGTARIALDNSTQVRAATPADFRGCIRLFGVGGVFGYYGLFRTSTLGKCTWHVTNRSNAVVIVSDGRTVLVSPDDTDRFLAALGGALAVTPGLLPLASDKPSFTGTRNFNGLILGAAGLALAIASLLYSPGPPSYTLTSAALTIHDRFYPVTVHAEDFDVTRIRVVDLDSDKDWRPVKRTKGFANARYRSGWFLLANGQRARVYSAGGRRLVLLPAKDKGAPLLLETKDPDAFVAEVRGEWTPPV